jgi:hypothetical protein
MCLTPFHVVALIAAVKPRVAWAALACRVIWCLRLQHAVSPTFNAALGRLNRFRFPFRIAKIGQIRGVVTPISPQHEGVRFSKTQ